MEKDVIQRYKAKDRNDVIRFLKSMWSDNPQACPMCKGKLDYLHKKAKKSNCDWICTSCGERFDTIKILNELNER